MYINISRYAGMAGKIGEAAPKVQRGFVPLLKGQPGFLGYTGLASEQGDIVALHIWENADAMAASRENIRGWLQANADEYLEPTERFQGEVAHHAMASPQSGGHGQSLYCMVRKSDNNPEAPGGDEMRKALGEAVQKVPGFRGAYFARSAEEPHRTASVLFFDNREHAAAAHEAALAVLHKHQPNVTNRVAASGQTAVLAMA